VLNLHRRRQDDVRIACSIGEEMFDDDTKQIPSRETTEHLLLIGDASRRIAGIYEQSVDPRCVGLEQYFTEPLHIQCACLSRSEIISPQRFPVQPKEAARVVENSAAW